ncbi:PilZ domain-containing protein [Sphingomonas sp.]|uniref:PilZ domain-containing protein n=1 Tax=Sphingomonas sp. TaxID=28214 RepID=UPI003CC53FA3
MFNRREAALVEQRDEARHRVQCVRVTTRGDAADPGEQPFAALLDNISSFGCRLVEAAGLEPGERLWVRLPGSPPVIAAVAWVEGDVAGCRFAAPISQNLMRSLLPGAV